MSWYERMCKGLCEAIPEKRRQSIAENTLRFAGIDENYDFWLGKRIFLTMLFAFIGFLVPLSLGKLLGFVEFDNGVQVMLFGETWVIFVQVIILSAVFAVVFAITAMVLFYLSMYFQIENRALFVESVLPDFLILVSNNINAGMTPFSAFRNSARKEFGPLSSEVRIAATKSLGSQSFTDALRGISANFRSSELGEIIGFLVQSLRSGGRLSTLLENTSNSLRQRQEMKKEMLASTKMYVIFVVFVVVIGAPLLLGVSVKFLDMVTSIQAQASVDVSSIQTVSFLSTQLAITPEFMQILAVALLTINALLSSLFIGVIGSGKPKLGIRHFPAILIASLVVFFIALQVLSGFLGV